MSMLYLNIITQKPYDGQFCVVPRMNSTPRVGLAGCELPPGDNLAGDAHKIGGHLGPVIMGLDDEVTAVTWGALRSSVIPIFPWVV